MSHDIVDNNVVDPNVVDLNSYLYQHFAFNIMGITQNSLPDFFRGYISGLIGYDVTDEWDECLSGVAFFYEEDKTWENTFWGMLLIQNWLHEFKMISKLVNVPFTLLT